jgi:hypothetical protein
MKIDKWEVYTAVGTDDAPGDSPHDGLHEPAGPWEPIGAGVTNNRHNGGPEDMETTIVWRRPLSKVDVAVRLEEER